MKILESVYSVKSYNKSDKQIQKRIYESLNSFKLNHLKLLNDQRVSYIKVFQLTSDDNWIETNTIKKEEKC
jgi:hypothetical protein